MYCSVLREDTVVVKNVIRKLRELFIIYICVYIHTKGDLWWGFCSHDYGGWEALPSAVGKLETRKALSLNLVWIWKPENQGSQWYKSQPKGKRRTNVPAQTGWKGPNPLLLWYFVLFRPPGIWMMPTHDQILISIGNNLTDAPRNNVYSGHPVGQ